MKHNVFIKHWQTVEFSYHYNLICIYLYVYHIWLSSPGPPRFQCKNMIISFFVLIAIKKVTMAVFMKPDCVYACRVNWKNYLFLCYTDNIYAQILFDRRRSFLQFICKWFFPVQTYFYEINKNVTRVQSRCYIAACPQSGKGSYISRNVRRGVFSFFRFLQPIWVSCCFTNYPKK